MIDEIRPMRDRPTPAWVIVCGLLGWLAAMIQVGLLNRLPILGAGAELALATAALIGWRRGALCGAVSGLVGGFVVDALCTTGLSLSPLLFVAAGLYMSVMIRRFFDHPLTFLFSFLLPAVAVGAVRALQVGTLKHFFGVVIGAMLWAAMLYLPRYLRGSRGKRR